MAGRVWLLPLSLALSSLGLLFLLCLTLYCLMERRRVQQRYQELIDTRPSVPSCTAPLVLVSQGAFTTPREIPFVLPPLASSARPAESHVSTETAAESQREELHRGSLCVSSRFPVGSVLSGLYPSSPAPDTAPPAGPQLCFSVQYSPGSELLRVTVFRLCHLPRRLHPRLCLVELQLLPDDRRPLQAKARSTGPHPEFNHCLLFQVSSGTVRASVLVLVVLAVGAEGKLWSVGRVEVALRGDLCYTGRVQWRALQTQPQTQASELGELLVSLGYSPSVQRLSVGVRGGRGLQLQDSSTGLMLRVSLQSPSQLRTKPGPVLSQSGPEEDLRLMCSFRLKQRRLEQSCVKIEVLQKDTGTVPVGALVLGPLLFSRGPQMEHWMEMTSALGDTVEQWHPLGPAV